MAPLAEVAAIVLDGEDEGWSPASPASAAALSRVLSAALAVAPGPGAVHRVIVDHSGERWRFRDWALAETRCLGGLPRGWQLWHPADCIGDAGAAFVPLAASMAVAAFARGYGGPGRIALVASADSGARACLVLGPGGQ